MAAAISRITGLILAGGEGRRMGGVDKGLLELGGQALVGRAADRLRPQVGSIIVSANRNLERYRALGFEPIADTVVADNPHDTEDHDRRSAGPLAGVLAGLERCTTDWMACVPCDSPAFPADLVARLGTSAQEANAPAAYAATDAGAHPVFMLVRRDLVPGLRRFLAEGGRRVLEWHGSVSAVSAHFPDEACFTNINTPEDLIGKS
jgi:molybdopterin-guanine dinucleotide biosynthesis protein A